MALHNKKLSITADTIINDTRIVTYGAIMNLETGEMNVYERRLDMEAAKDNRDIVRADRSEFEDFAYEMQDDIKAMLLVDARSECEEDA